jgi:putative salt-induced outer membrane protein YdiY
MKNQPFTLKNSLAVNLALAGLLIGATTALPQALEGPDDVSWERSIAVGVTLNKGNSDTLLATANARAERIQGPNELRLGFDATYGEADKEKNAESYRAFGQYDRLFTERLFGYLRVEGFRDTIADVKYRLTVGPGAGYHFIKTDHMQLTGEVGPSFIHERLGTETSSYIALRLAERFEYQINERARLWQSLEFLPQVDDFNNFLLRGEIGVEVDMTERLSLRTYVQNFYDNQPAPGRKKNDVKLVSALAYRF